MVSIMLQISRALIPIFFVLYCSGLALAAVSDEELAAEKFSQVIDRSFPKMSALWPHTSIPVCWEDLSHSDAALRGEVQEAVHSTWEANSKVRFTGWAQCAPNNRGIRIQVSDQGPHTNGLGKEIDGLQNGMVLNFAFQDWSTDCANSGSEFFHTCVKAIAIHEFGHALGFAHEQNRDDTPGSCKEKPQGESGDTKFTPWDPKSVMNYCYNIYFRYVTLSPLDIFSVQRLYGSP